MTMRCADPNALARAALVAGFVLLSLWLVAPGVSAQGATVCVIRVDPAAEGDAAAIERMLGGVAVVPDPGYYAESMNRGLDPTGDMAMQQLVPPLGVTMALAPVSTDGQQLWIDFRHGATGAGLGVEAIPLEGGYIGAQGQQQLQALVGQKLQMVMGGGGPSGFTGGESASDMGSMDAEAGGEGDAASGESEAFGELAAELGMGSRAISWPTAAGRDSADTGSFLAGGVRARFAFGARAGFSFGPEFAYQTSIGHDVKELHIGGGSYDYVIRAHRFEAALVPRIAFDDDGEFRLEFALGYGVRNLRPESHDTLTPAFSVSGPLVRLGLNIPLAGRALRVQLRPEAQWLASVGEGLEQRGVQSGGLGYGFEAGLAVGVLDPIDFHASYRMVWASYDTRIGASAEDSESFLMLGVGRAL
ncbi:MAG: hypothetical protein OEZ06_13265 [Myxococcales bacterium]|nr:hypothetical protein [Myxococcales bacterium]